MIVPIHRRVLLMSKRDSGRRETFSIRFEALRAHRPLFAAFELFIMSVSGNAMPSRSSKYLPFSLCRSDCMESEPTNVSVNSKRVAVLTTLCAIAAPSSALLYLYPDIPHGQFSSFHCCRGRIVSQQVDSVGGVLRKP